jgi:UDP-GlcNAc:undecaprenyl-phosphate GlcNAc-1-phosphate transferase
LEVALIFTWITAAIGFAAGLLLSFALIAAAPRMGWVDHPDQRRKCHNRPMALTGGLVLWAVVLISQLMGWLPWPLHRIDWLGINVMALMGALDDRFDLRARYKAVVGCAVAVLLAGYSSSILLHTVDHVNFLSLRIPTHPALTFPILFFWFWSIPQAYNLIDGVNGLSMGLGLLILGVLGWHMGAQPMVLWGAMVATLVLNFPRAKHFLGDSGAMMLGTLFAVLSIRLLVAWNATLPIWVFAYPIVDVTMVVAIRAWNGQPLGGADRSHLHHWMMDRLHNQAWLATPILLVFAALPMLRATELPGARAISLAGGIALLALGAKGFRDRTRKPVFVERRFTPVRRELHFIPDPETRVAPGSQRAV